MANSNTTTATDAQIVISVEEDAFLLNIGLPWHKRHFVNPDISGDSLQFTAHIFRANKTVPRVLPHDTFQRCPAELLDTRCLSVDDHSLSHGESARTRKPTHSLYFHNAKPAASNRGDIRVITKRRDVNSRCLCRLQHCHAVFGFDDFTIYNKLAKFTPRFQANFLLVSNPSFSTQKAKATLIPI